MELESGIRVAVVSPFLDKSFGTERTVVEWLSNLPDSFEIHIYSQRVEDLPPNGSFGIGSLRFLAQDSFAFCGGLPQIISHARGTAACAICTMI